MGNKTQKIIANLRRVRTQLQSIAQGHRELLKECDKYYFHGAKNTDVSGYGSPNRNTSDFEDVYDDFGAYALYKLSGHLMGMTFNPMAIWCRIAADKDKPNDVELQWLQKATDKVHWFFRQASAKFYPSIAAAMPECVVGQGMLYADYSRRAGKPKLTFMAFPMVSVAHSLDGEGNLGAVVRTTQMTRSEIISRWPDAEYPDSFKVNTENNLNRKEFVYHTVLPNETYEQTVSAEERETLAQTQQGKWMSRYHVENEDVLLEAQSLEFMPYIPLRFHRRAGQTYGEGPGIWSLPSVKELSEMALDEQIARQLGAAPTMVEETGVLPDDIQLGRLHRIQTLRPLLGQTALSPLLPPNYFNFAALTQAKIDKREQIGANFYLDRLGTPVKTAEMREVEVLGRQQDNITELVPFSSGLDDEVAAPIVEIVLKFLWDTKQLEAPPSGLKPKLYLTTQLGKAQAAAANREIFNMLQEFRSMPEFMNAVIDRINVSKLLETLARPYTRDTTFIRSEEEALELQRQREQASQQAQMAQVDSQQLKNTADAEKSLAQAAQIRNQGGIM